MPTLKTPTKTKAAPASAPQPKPTAHIVAVENPCLLEKADTVNIHVCEAKMSDGTFENVIILTVINGLHIMQTVMSAADAKSFKDKFDKACTIFDKP